MLRQLVPLAADFLPAKTDTTNYPFSVLLLGVVVTVERIYVKSLHDKITLMNQEMNLLKYELERKKRREARIAYRNRTTFRSWKRTAAKKAVRPRRSSSIQKEIISAGAAAIQCHVIMDLIKNTPWTPVSHNMTKTESTRLPKRRFLC